MAWGRLGYIANGRHRPFRSAPWQILGWVRPLGLGNRIRTQSPSGVRRAGAGQAWSVLASSAQDAKGSLVIPGPASQKLVPGVLTKRHHVPEKFSQRWLPAQWGLLWHQTQPRLFLGCPLGWDTSVSVPNSNARLEAS